MIFKKNVKGRIISVGNVNKISVYGKYDEATPYLFYEGCYCDDCYFHDEILDRNIYYNIYSDVTIKYHLFDKNNTINISEIITSSELKENQEIDMIYNMITKKIRLSE